MEKKIDRRVRKTKQQLQDGFIQLRKKKDLKDITVKELCELTDLNRGTFYLHYKDIYDLSDQLETDVVASVIEAIPNPQNCLEDPAVLAKNMFLGYLSRDTIIRILFSGTRAGELVRKVEYQLKKILFDAHPEYKQDPSVNVVLSYTVYGGYYAFFENRQYGDATVVDIISQISSEAMNLL